MNAIHNLRGAFGHFFSQTVEGMAHLIAEDAIRGQRPVGPQPNRIVAGGLANGANRVCREQQMHYADWRSMQWTTIGALFASSLCSSRRTADRSLASAMSMAFLRLMLIEDGEGRNLKDRIVQDFGGWIVAALNVLSIFRTA